MNQYSAIIDIGSSKILCLICSVDQKESLIVHGAGIKEYDGYRHGVFQNEQGLRNAVVDALDMAEREAKHRVREISVGVPAPFLRLQLQDGAVEVHNKRIEYSDIEALMNASMTFDRPQGFELMHSTPVGFMVDGAYRPDMPIGLPAKTLSARISHVMVDGRFKALISDALASVGLDADMYIGVPLSEALFVVPEEERIHGAILLDVGGTHTDVCYVQGNALIACETIDVGGEHFVSDLCYGLSTQRAVAEGVKRRYVYSLDYQDNVDVIRIPGGGTLRVEHAAVQYIIEARTKELAELIMRTIFDMGVAINTDTPVYLTGGGISLMRGSCEYLENVMGIPIQVRMPWMPRLSSPNYASGFSVMDFVIHAAEDKNAGLLQGLAGKNKFMRKIRDFFIK